MCVLVVGLAYSDQTAIIVVDVVVAVGIGVVIKIVDHPRTPQL